MPVIDDHSTQKKRVVGRRSNQDVVIIDEWKAEGASYPWYKIRLDNGEGWIYGKYVELK
ncbi:MAG: SH3 domain-containing protein [Pyramidobacter sp.]|nr:SH3 domain-containing protein [Pyramidobacter sp.]